MSNANRDYVIVYDVKNSSLILSRPLIFYITDKNTSNIFVKLVTKVSVEDGIDRYTDIENASNYVLTMRVIKPSNEVKSLEATQHEEGSIFQFDLTEDFKDIPGKYICELTISTIVSSRQELTTSDPFSYEVKRSILSNAGEIIETEDTTVEKLLNNLDTTKTEFSSQIKNIENKLHYITPEIFGAKGDGIVDDTEALRETIKYALNNSTMIRLEKTYKTTDTLVISGDLKIFGENARIIYEGTDYAIRVTRSSNANINICKISALNGGCIEIYSTSGSDYVQYLTIFGKELYAKNKCIFFNVTGGWTNEIDVYHYAFRAGNYGVYADALNQDRINGITFKDVAVEGVETGFYIANNCHYWSILNARYLESFTTAIETVGLVELNIIGYSAFYFSRDTEVKFSNRTKGVIISPITKDDGATISYIAEITEGAVIPHCYRNYINLYSKPNIVLSKEAFYNYFLVNENTGSITLSRAYGIPNGINEFIVKCDFNSGTDFTIYSSDGNIIFNNTTNNGWLFLRFQWFKEVGWKIEKVSYLTPTK
ncbi:MAG: phage baseplate upper protein [Clostridium sp.]|nr:phage baseplate upper protein [Clostridium sp.]